MNNQGDTAIYRFAECELDIAQQDFGEMANPFRPNRKFLTCSPTLFATEIGWSARMT